MSLGSDIARHIPFLRRYARALTGSQMDGDGYVRATLEVLVQSPARFDQALPPRVALYRVFHEVWSDGGLSSRPRQTRGGGISDRLITLASSRRQALLLTAMEGFGREDAGEILGRTVDEIDALVADAVRELMAQPPTTVLIIEDEPVISLDLASIVADLGHTVVGTATTSSEAVAIARATRPGFVLADIQLADGSSGIDAVHEILSAMDVPVIFITAYPERLLTGERPEPTFLVTKPFIADSVKSTIGHALLLAAEARSRAA